MSSAEKALTRKIFSLSDDAEITFNTIGWTSRVYMYNNGQYVAKFPRYPQVIEEYKAEVEACNLIAGQNFDISVPVIKEVGEGYRYIAYEGVRGMTLDTVHHIPEEQQSAIGRTIGSFLLKFRTLCITNGQTQTVEDEIRELQEKYEMGKALLKSHVSHLKFSMIDSFVTQKTPAQLRALGETMVLSHGDLGYWNMVLQPDGTVGIIDFGDVGYYDESRDFVGLTDQAVLQAALSGFSASDTMKQKIQIRKKLLPLLELPYHIGKDNHAGIQHTLNLINSTCFEK